MTSVMKKAEEVPPWKGRPQRAGPSCQDMQPELVRSAGGNLGCRSPSSWLGLHLEP